MGVATTFEVAVPASTLALAETFEREPETTVRMERTVGGNGQPREYVWVSGVEDDRAEKLLGTDPSVVESRKLGENDDGELFEVRFESAICEFTDAIAERGGVILRATAGDGVWNFQLRFADRGNIADVFDDEFSKRYEATVTRLYGSNDAPSAQTGVTDKQRKALSTAFELGYYSVPRDVDLRTVGERLDISRQAVSERLRRGHELLVGDYLGKTSDE
ncbi:helix-turn-helix domain-containing protein [Halorussus lipolyticus]|uniref:helix-turn-helix domain-containing protein n=1 Tax=Halorussus lipolyticus TaxID=3034024 RepID=UPI0023E86552|nr:helix-turn-helix domain-containing protein [Halorussus sp. DT80]